MSSILLEIFSFLKNPYSPKQEIVSRKDKYTYFSRLAIVSMIVSGLFFGILMIEHFILKRYGIELKQKDFGFRGVYAILIFVFLGPFSEELLFRFPLSFRKKDVNTWLFILLGMVGFYIISLLCKDMLNKTEKYFIRFFYLIIGAGIIHLFNTLSETSLEKMKYSFGKYIVWVSIAIFTLLHLSNVANFDIRLLPIYLFNLFPVFFLAIILSLYRLRLGFFYGFLFHAAWNFLPALLHIWN